MNTSMTATLCLCLLFAAEANTFLERPTLPDLAETLSMLDELEKVAGRDHREATERRVERMEEVLQPGFLSLPKSSDGGLQPDAVRYLLHRTFVERHAWFVKGLTTSGAAWNSSSPAAMIEQHVESDVHGMFQSRLDTHSFDLHHVAVLAATLEKLVHAETINHLHAVYKLLDLSHHEDEGSEEEVASVIDTFMLFHVIGKDPSNVTKTDLKRYQSRIHKVYPTWEATREWARNIRTEMLSAPGAPASNTFAGSVVALEAVADRYGKFQDSECRDLKALLMKDEYMINGKPSGRVKLDAFYRSALEGNWQFNERVEYLRSLGALDESDPESPSVVIPNYINSPSNCVASSKFYSVCCIDECESLMGHLERNIAAPEASPERILELVSALPSSTLAAPHEISEPLKARLQDIAAPHGGKVPLHTRLFTQWMHHVYPRECQYPHLSGTTKPLTRQEMKELTGGATKTDKETMEWHVAQGKRKPVEHVEIPWSHEDEHLVWRPTRKESRSFSSVARGLMSCGAVVSIAMYLVRTTWAAVGSVSVKDEKHFV